MSETSEGDPMDPGELITRGQAAEILNVGVKTIDYHFARGTLTGYQVGIRTRGNLGRRYSRRQVEQLAADRAAVAVVEPPAR